MQKLKIKRRNIVYVGDMMIDKLTAKNARVDYIHALYGYSPKKINHEKKLIILSFNDNEQKLDNMNENYKNFIILI